MRICFEETMNVTFNHMEVWFDQKMQHNCSCKKAKQFWNVHTCHAKRRVKKKSMWSTCSCSKMFTLVFWTMHFCSSRCHHFLFLFLWLPLGHTHQGNATVFTSKCVLLQALHDGNVQWHKQNQTKSCWCPFSCSLIYPSNVPSIMRNDWNESGFILCHSTASQSWVWPC